MLTHELLKKEKEKRKNRNLPPDWQKLADVHNQSRWDGDRHSISEPKFPAQSKTWKKNFVKKLMKKKLNISL